jgi:hypothetical protein
MFRSYRAMRGLSVDTSESASAVFVERFCAALGVVRAERAVAGVAGALSSLASLQLRGSAAVAVVADGGGELAALTGLTELTLDGRGAIKKIDPQKLCPVLRGLQQLRVLCLDHVGSPGLFGRRHAGVVAVAGVLALPRSLPLLERLSLVCVDGLGDDEMAALVAALSARGRALVLRALRLGQLEPASSDRPDARRLLPSLGSLRALTALDLGFVDGDGRVHGPELVAGLAAGLSALTALTELRLRLQLRRVDDDGDGGDGGGGDGDGDGDRDMRRGGLDSRTITPQLAAALARLTQLRTMAADVMVGGRGASRDAPAPDGGREDASIGRLVASTPGLRRALVAFLCSPNLSALERLRICGNCCLELRGPALLAGVAAMPMLAELALERLMLAGLALEAAAAAELFARAQLSRLRRLELHNVHGLTAAQLAAALAAGRTERRRLAHLDIDNLYVGALTLDHDSRDNRNHQRALAQLVAALPPASIRWLRLRKCGLHAGPAAAGLANLARITHLDLSDNPLPQSLRASLEAQARARAAREGGRCSG